MRTACNLGFFDECLLNTDLTQDEQPSELNEGKGDGGVCSSTMVEVNCNGLTATSTQLSENNVEAPENEHSAEAAVEEEKQQQQQLQEDQQNANQPDSSSDTREELSVDAGQQNCNGSAEDLQPPSTAVSPDSVTVELKEEDASEAKVADEQMLYGGDAKREDKEKGTLFLDFK